MRKVVLLLSLLLVFAVTGNSGKASESDLAKENADLKQRVDKLDKELQDIKKSLIQQDGMKENQTRMPVWSSLDIQIYGYLKFDAAYDDSQIMNGNFAQWVTPENMSNNDDQFNMTANQSRFGVNITGPDNGRVKTGGRVEVDFYGGSNENKSHLMMRHAYMKLDWPAEKFSIIAGQTSDVISPLVPSTVNYSVCWWTGNIGYRRPQFRLTKELSLDSDVDVKLEGALARTIGRDNVALAGVLDSGEDDGFPTVQARASVTLPVFGPGRSTLGVSGHLGHEEYDTTAFGDHKDFKSWSLNFDLTQPVCKKMTIKAELFTGENLDAYLGGIGQGVTTAAGINQYDEVGSAGGWIAASLGPWENVQYNLGIGMDDVDRGDVQVGNRTLNRSIFGNIFYALSKNVEWALELSHWRTEYRGTGDADSLRVQTALIYKF